MKNAALSVQFCFKAAREDQFEEGGAGQRCLCGLEEAPSHIQPNARDSRLYARHSSIIHAMAALHPSHAGDTLTHV